MLSFQIIVDFMYLHSYETYSRKYNCVELLCKRNHIVLRVHTHLGLGCVHIKWPNVYTFINVMCTQNHVYFLTIYTKMANEVWEPFEKSHFIKQKTKWAMEAGPCWRIWMKTRQ